MIGYSLKKRTLNTFVIKIYTIIKYIDLRFVRNLFLGLTLFYTHLTHNPSFLVYQRSIKIYAVIEQNFATKFSEELLNNHF